MDGVELFDVAGRFPGGRGFSGAACDGRYVYLAPLNNGQLHGQVARFDTTLAFDDQRFWGFDMTDAALACLRGDAFFDSPIMRRATTLPDGVQRRTR